LKLFESGFEDVVAKSNHAHVQVLLEQALD
jgi:hypothetical protein